MPWDKVSLGLDDKIVIAWPDGTTYAFATKPKALYDPVNWPRQRVEFWVSPGQASDILDKANYQDSGFWRAVSLFQPSDPVIVAGGTGKFAARVVLGVLFLAAEKQVAKPVIYQQINSSVVR